MESLLVRPGKASRMLLVLAEQQQQSAAGLSSVQLLDLLECILAFLLYPLQNLVPLQQGTHCLIAAEQAWIEAAAHGIVQYAILACAGSWTNRQRYSVQHVLAVCQTCLHAAFVLVYALK